MQLFFEPEATSDQFVLNIAEARHCLKILRKRKGDTVHIVDGRGTFYQCIIQIDDAKNCQLKVVKTTDKKSFSPKRHIAISPTKNMDRIEWFVEKAVEIGIDSITFILCHNSERRTLKLDRIEKKAVSAMKQSGKALLPEIHKLIDFDKHITNVDEACKFIAYVDKTNENHLKNLVDHKQSTVILIGPEGDFSKKEIESALSCGFQAISLGDNRLRTETAGVVACTFLNA